MHYETECGCEQHGHEGRPGMGHGAKWGYHGYGGRGGMHHSGQCHCGCHYGGGMHHGSDFGSFGHRRFISKEEVIAHLEEYLKQLKAEAAGVEEHITELKKGHS